MDRYLFCKKKAPLKKGAFILYNNKWCKNRIRDFPAASGSARQWTRAKPHPKAAGSPEQEKVLLKI